MPTRRHILAALAGLPAASPAAAQIAMPTPAVPLPTWRRWAVPAAAAAGKPVITLIMDDMGVNRVQSARAVQLPGPLTLSWLPYARQLQEQVADGAARGHETMVHMPMEPLGNNDPGPNALRVSLPAEVNLAYLRAALDSIPTAVGLNQHEASVASGNAALLDIVMAELKARDMLFVDSVVIPGLLPLKRARAAGLPSIARDVFLDHENRPEMIRMRLEQAEAIARKTGFCTVIGHPRRHTMDVLEKLLPPLLARGVVLWPASAMVAARGHASMQA